MSVAVTGASIDAISFHYDLGSNFYRLWLDESMTYSAALYELGDDLASAQRRKLDFHLDNIDVENARSILDIGCGWGGLLARALERRPGLRVEGLTLSVDQAAYARTLGLPHANFLVRSWRDHKPAELYDGIVSIGAFEHFAGQGLSAEERIAAYRDFFRTCRDWLKPGGALSLQTIAFDRLDERWMSSFIKESIFPESMLPRPSEILAACDGLLSAELLCNHAGDYARTCREWSMRLAAQYERAVALVGAQKVDDYDLYLKMSASAFAQRGLMLLRLRLRNYQ
jgi:cyclopropane-fatty-acyl-phospholipid synthase